MKKAFILHGGGKFTQKGDLFAKDVLRIGSWTHPATGQKIDVDAARLDRLAKNTNALLANEVKVPYPDGHRLSALNNLGYWPGPFVRHGDSLVGVCAPTDETAKKKMLDGSVDAVSVCIEFGFKDQKGAQYDEVITHVCATSYPVITGQERFVALSTEAGDQLYVPVEKQLLAATGASDVMGVHDELRKTVEKHAEEYLAKREKHGADHDETRKAAGKLSDSAHRFHRQATVVRDHLNNMSGGPTFYDRAGAAAVTGATQDDVTLALVLAVDATEKDEARRLVNLDGTMKSPEACARAMVAKGYGEKIATALCAKLCPPKKN